MAAVLRGQHAHVYAAGARRVPAPLGVQRGGAAPDGYGGGVQVRPLRPGPLQRKRALREFGE